MNDSKMTQAEQERLAIYRAFDSHYDDAQPLERDRIRRQALRWNGVVQQVNREMSQRQRASERQAKRETRRVIRTYTRETVRMLLSSKTGKIDDNAAYFVEQASGFLMAFRSGNVDTIEDFADERGFGALTRSELANEINGIKNGLRLMRQFKAVRGPRCDITLPCSVTVEAVAWQLVHAGWVGTSEMHCTLSLMPRKSALRTL